MSVTLVPMLKASSYNKTCTSGKRIRLSLNQQEKCDYQAWKYWERIFLSKNDQVMLQTHSLLTLRTCCCLYRGRACIKQVLSLSKVLLDKGTWNTGMMSENTKLQVILMMQWKPLILWLLVENSSKVSRWVLVTPMKSMKLRRCSGFLGRAGLTHTHTHTQSSGGLVAPLALAVPSALAVAIVAPQLPAVCPSLSLAHSCLSLSPQQCCQLTQALNWATRSAGIVPFCHPFQRTDAGRQRGISWTAGGAHGLGHCR